MEDHGTALGGLKKIPVAAGLGGGSADGAAVLMGLERLCKTGLSKVRLCEIGAQIGAEIFESLRELEKLKGIPVEYMTDRLKQALTNAYRKDREDNRDIPAENVVVDLSEKGLFMYQVKTVVEEVEDPAVEMTLEAAKAMDPKASVGETVSFPIDIQKFGRIAAQTAKQVVIQGIREAERGAMYENYSSKAQEMLTATVQRVDPTGDLFLRLTQNGEQSDAVFRVSEQIPGESWYAGDLIRVYVLDVRRSERGPMVHVSRTHPNLVRRLFELETPEIADGQVEIRNIAREPGSRTKIAVRAAMEGIDPVGACVGPRGGRVAAIVDELNGEKIDIVVYSDDVCEYVRAALSPAEVISVTLLPDQKKACTVIVPDGQLSLAIGKEGQNARLAARLTGCKIDIKAESQAEI